MKRISFSLLAAGIMAFSACNSGNDNKVHEGHDMAFMNMDSILQVDTTMNMNVKTITPTYSDVDAGLASAMQQITKHYLHIKNALANDDAVEAADGAKALEKTFNKLDKSLLTAEQKKTWDELEDDRKEHAEHIGETRENISYQRAHFASLSNEMYSLVTAFGAGGDLYHDHCPMYNNNQGAMWLSESMEIKNPYMGAQMPACGSIEEIIK